MGGERTRSDYLNPSMYQRLFDVMTYDNVLALRLCLETGMRVDDALSLRDIDLKGRTIHYIAAKTGKPDKKVISANLAKAIVSLGVNRGGYYFKHRTDPTKHRTRQAVWTDIKRAQRAIGLKGQISPHSARKSYAVELRKEKGIAAVQTALQHDNSATTMLYAFADMLNGNSSACGMSGNYDIESFADLIADKVAERLSTKKAMCH